MPIDASLIVSWSWVDHLKDNLNGTEEVTYYIHDSFDSSYPIGYGYGNTLSHFSYEEEFIEDSFASIDEKIDLDFTRVYTNNGSDIDIYCISSHTGFSDLTLGTAWAMGQGIYSWFEIAWDWTDDWPNDRFTIIHEIGHTLGLGHPGGDGYNPYYDASDTVMSYNSGPNGWASTWTNSDIKALQAIWGVEDDNTSGYLRSDFVVASTWSDMVRINIEKTGSTSDSVIQAKQVDKSEYDSGFVGSIVNGTSSNDIIRGLAGFDQLFGNAGADLIHGGNGRDIIDGGSGSDELHGDFGWNTFLDQQDGSKDLIAIKSDQHLSNFWYGKAGNSPNGEKADFIEGLDAIDEIKIIGVFTSDISVVENVTARGVTGIGIYAKGTLEAVYTGGNLSTSQIQNMTTGDGSTTAMNNQMWSYWGDNTVPPLQA